MAIRPDWNIGKINLVAGSAEFTTVNAMLNMSAVEPGDVIITPSGHILVIKEITGANSGTLMLPCPAGAAGTELPLRIRFQPDGSRVAGALRSASALLSGGNVEALAGLIGQDGKIPVFTGAGTMGLADFSAVKTTVDDVEARVDDVEARVDDVEARVDDAETAINNRVRFDAEQGLNANQQNQARQNISAFQQPTGTVNQFVRGNGSLQSIVGTVAQSGGSIVQYGNNANGEFIRFADGTQICWSPLIIGIDINNVSGAIFRSNNVTVPFPASFVVNPNGFSHATSQSQWANVLTLGASAGWGITLFNATSVSNASCRLGAIGRWF